MENSSLYIDPSCYDDVMFERDNRALFERSDEQEYTGYSIDPYIERCLKKYSKLTGSRLA